MSQDILKRLTETLQARKYASPESSYVSKLFSKGEDAILKKVGEEATEVILASKGGDKSHLVYETADLWFHSMVLLAKHGLSAEDLPFFLLFGWGLPGKEWPGGAGDGVIALRSQLEPRAQREAWKIRGFPESHMGILENPESIRLLREWLDAHAPGGR